MTSSPHSLPDPASTNAAKNTAHAGVLQINSVDLLQGQRLLEIEHAGQRYQLRLTRENKLILTK